MDAGTPNYCTRAVDNSSGLICDINADINPSSYEKAIHVDAILENVHRNAIPPVLRWETSVQ